MDPATPTPKREPGVYQGTPPSSPEKSEGSPSPRLIRTMKSDAAEAIKKQNETFVSIALAEERKQAQARREAAVAQQAQAEVMRHAPKPRGRTTIVVIFLLIIVALGLAYIFISPKLGTLQISGVSLPSFGSSSSKKETGSATEQVIIPLAPALIPPQYEKRFLLNKETPEHLFATIAVERTGGVIEGTIKNLYFAEEVSIQDGALTTNTISVNRLFTFANIRVPEILTRSLETPFMVGLLGEEGSSAAPFIILKVSSYDTGLAGMLEWETSLPNLFDTLFGIKTEAVEGKKFRDVVVTGKDARVLDSASGIRIAYAFADQNTIVITVSRSALERLIPMIM